MFIGGLMVTELNTRPEYPVRKQGTSLDIEVTVYEEDEVTPANLTDAYAKFSYIKVGSGGTLASKECTFADNNIITGLTPLETAALSGQYKFEIRLKTADGKIDGQIDGKFTITDSINPWTT